MTTIFTLLCYVRGDDYKNAFEVKIGKEETVAELREAIKKENTQMCRAIDANLLVLWKVSILCDQNLAKNVDDLNLVDDTLPPVSAAHPNNDQIQSLSPVLKLSEVFLEPPVGQHVHIVVNSPLSNPTISEVDSVRNHNIIAAIKTSAFLPLVQT
jgi:Crinkler effector protein N-terminal domain